MSAEHGPTYKRIATLDSHHPSYASRDPRAPLVIMMDSPTAGAITVERGRYPYNNRYRLTGNADLVTIIGSDVRRGQSMIIDVASPAIGGVSACSDVTVLADQSTQLVLQSGAQAFPK